MTMRQCDAVLMHDQMMSESEWNCAAHTAPCTVVTAPRCDPSAVHDALVQNDPLYLRTFTSNNPSSASSPSSVPFAATSLNPAAAGPLNWNNDQGLKFHYFVHTSLDAIEEKSTTRPARTQAWRWRWSGYDVS